MIPHIKDRNWKLQTGDIEHEMFRVIKDFVSIEAPHVDPIICDLLATDYTNFIAKAVEKFEKGQREHGGDIRDRDLHKECENEILDMFHYHNAKKWPSHLRAK